MSLNTSLMMEKSKEENNNNSIAPTLAGAPLALELVVQLESKYEDGIPMREIEKYFVHTPRVLNGISYEYLLHKLQICGAVTIQKGYLYRNREF